ncbi:MAG: JmjC domain-containing protein [Tsuneonella sp.]
MTPRLVNFDSEQFLRDVWQQKPLLIRNPWQAWANPLDPDELAGLACEPGVDSRLVHATGSTDRELDHGPFRPSRFNDLAENPWTLLVQAVDQYVPEVAALLDPFRFIPDWRIDDVMVSYASDGGGVGPHFDQYDVFLVQGLGQRRWRIGAKCDDATPLLPHDGLRLLANFEPVEEWILDPGDILYVPPGFAHDGVAVGDDCMTYSIGFRAPSRSDLLSAWTDRVLETLREDDRYADPGLAPQANPGEITPEALDRLQAMAIDALRDRSEFRSWFGEYVTAPRDDRMDWAPEEPVAMADLARMAADAVSLERNPACRFAFVRHDDATVTLFVDGTSWPCSGEMTDFAMRLCASPRLPIEPAMTASGPVAELLVELVNRGCVAFTDGA